MPIQSMNFKRILAHKLGNLVMMTRNPVELLDEPDLLPDQRQQLKDMLVDSLTRMEEMVKDLTDLGRAEELEDELVITSPPGVVVEEAVSRATTLAQSKGITLVYEEKGQAPHDLTGQIELLGRALDGVIENAINYSCSGGRIEVSLAFEGDDALIRVSDTGLGVLPEDLKNIFEPFYHPKDMRTSSVPNMGLKLTLTRAVIEGHGGRVEVESVVDKGSVFTLRLPLNRPAP